MSQNGSGSSIRISSTILYYWFASSALLLFAFDGTITPIVAWIPSTKRSMPALRSSSALFRTGYRSVGRDPQGTNTTMTTQTIRSPSRLFSSSPQQTTTDTETSRGVGRNHERTVDATLVGEYMIQMKSTALSASETVLTWSLYSINDVVTILSSEGEEAPIWTDGTEATEALYYGLETIPKLNPELSIESLVSTESDAIESKITEHSGTKDDQKLLSLLRILQAQWAMRQKTTTMGKLQEKTSEPSLRKEDDSLWRISMDAVSSPESITELFQETGLLDFEPKSTEWVEMMTGSSQIVGRLPRSWVHKFNVLHRGIGAFVTKDRPINFSLLSSPSAVEDFPNLYVHRRASDKRIFPSLYDMWVGGVSLAGENPELTAQREIAEELGLSKALTTPLSEDGTPFLTCLVCTAYNRCLVDLFQYTMDTSCEQVTWQKEEVAWGDFVDYRVIMASADLSIQRGASERSWPGSYPPIQSEFQGVLPEGDDVFSKVAKYDGNWKEWDYVPDGLLVWEAWLDFLEEQRDGHREQRGDQKELLTFEIEFNDEEGKTEMVPVELASMEDIVPKSLELASRLNADVDDIKALLQKLWTDVTFVPVHSGPSVSIEINDNDAECTIELPSGLVLELRPSTIGENAGLGLFVRKKSSDIENVLQTQGSAFCGYGPCGQITDSLDGFSEYQRQRSFEFMLADGFDSYVWHKGSLLTVWDVLQSTGATGVKSHHLVAVEEYDDSSSSRAGLKLIHNPEEPCYMIPPAEPPQTKSLTIQTIGHMCNDLAGGKQGQSEEEYDVASNKHNLLVLVSNVVVRDGILEPSGMPILTLSKTVGIANVNESIEVGLRYGVSYWKNENQK